MKKTADAHWSYIKNLTEATLPAADASIIAFTRKEIIDLIGFHYKSAFLHGWKHALEARSATETLTSEATAKIVYAVDPARIKLRSECCAGNLRSAALSPAAARRVLDADNSVETIFKNDAEGKSPTEEEIAHILTFLREDR